MQTRLGLNALNELKNNILRKKEHIDRLKRTKTIELVKQKGQARQQDGDSEEQDGGSDCLQIDNGQDNREDGSNSVITTDGKLVASSGRAKEKEGQRKNQGRSSKERLEIGSITDIDAQTKGNKMREPKSGDGTSDELSGTLEGGEAKKVKKRKVTVNEFGDRVLNTLQEDEEDKLGLEGPLEPNLYDQSKKSFI